jgi:hypothetical protein
VNWIFLGVNWISIPKAQVSTAADGQTEETAFTEPAIRSRSRAARTIVSEPRRNGRLSGRNHFPSSAKSPGNKPVLALPNQGVRSCWPSFSTRFTASSFGPPFPASLGREESYDRGRRGSGCHFQHQHLRGSCFRCVSDTLMGIFMDRSTFPAAADPSRRSHHLPRAALGADHRLAALRRLFQ